MLKEDDPRIEFIAHWPGRALPTQRPLSELRQDPEAIQTDNPCVAPHSIEVTLVESNAKRFGGRRTFIEDIETTVPAFYNHRRPHAAHGGQRPAVVYCNSIKTDQRGRYS